MAAGAGGKERKIMVAVDESEESRYALSWCLENLVCDAESRKSKTVLVLLYVRPPPPAYTALDGKGIFSAEMAAILERHGNEVASSVMDRAKALCKNLPHVKVEGLVECGDARDVICEMVDRVGASILVVGSHGYGTIKRYMACHLFLYCVGMLALVRQVALKLSSRKRFTIQKPEWTPLPYGLCGKEASLMNMEATAYVFESMEERRMSRTLFSSISVASQQKLSRKIAVLIQCGGGCHVTSSTLS